MSCPAPKENNIQSTTYRQEELSACEDVEFLPMTPLISSAVGVTPRATPRTTPTVSPKQMPQLSPQCPTTRTLSLRRQTRGGVTISPSRRGRGLLSDEVSELVRMMYTHHYSIQVANILSKVHRCTTSLLRSRQSIQGHLINPRCRKES